MRMTPLRRDVLKCLALQGRHHDYGWTVDEIGYVIDHKGSKRSLSNTLVSMYKLGLVQRVKNTGQRVSADPRAWCWVYVLPENFPHYMSSVQPTLSEPTREEATTTTDILAYISTVYRNDNEAAAVLRRLFSANPDGFYSLCEFVVEVINADR